MAEKTTVKHTPGPWVARPDARDGLDWRVDVDPPNGETDLIALVPGWPDESSESNARLIASAPELSAQRDELLVACERLVAMEPDKSGVCLYCNYATGDFHNLSACPVAMARAAIDKPENLKRREVQ